MSSVAAPTECKTAKCYFQAETAQTIRLPPYPLPHAYHNIAKSELDEIEREGIIKHPSSEWAFPIVLVKKDGSLHMCIDYRHLNAIADANAYPMPHMDDMIDALRKSK